MDWNELMNATKSKLNKWSLSWITSFIMQEESGSIMVEATMYFPLVVMVITFIICVSMVKLQQCMLEAMADRVATEAAECVRENGANSSQVYAQISQLAAASTLLNGALVAQPEVHIAESMIPEVDLTLRYTLNLPHVVEYIFVGSNYQGRIRNGVFAIHARSCAVNPVDVIRIADFSGDFNKYIWPNSDIGYDDYMQRIGELRRRL